MILQNLIIPLTIIIVGFVLRILYRKSSEKKVNLYFELDKPAFFSVIPPDVCFQNIIIWNKGNLPAHNLIITLDNKIIKEYKVSYKSSSEETFDEDINDTFLKLKFIKLRPKEKFTISFKSEKPLPQSFLINIKSDEIIAKSIVVGEKIIRWSDFIWGIAMGCALFYLGSTIYHLFFVNKIPPSQIIQNEDTVEQIPFSIKMITDRDVYSPGQNIEIIYQMINTSTETLKDISFILEIPGINLNYDAKYQDKPFLKTGEQTTYKRAIRIPDDFPHEKHKVKLISSTKNNNKSFRTEIFVYFNVQ